MAREKNIFDIEDIAYALFETTGKLSILPKSAKRPTVIEDIDVKEAPASLTDYVIINGKPQYQVIRELKMTVETVFEKLDIKSKRDLNNILVASYDTEKRFSRSPKIRGRLFNDGEKVWWNTANRNLTISRAAIP
ncbi:MAG: YetF domain-containing protein [Christensenellaceae bacterium]